MDNFDDIKQVWLSAKVTTLPNANDIVKTIKRYRLKHLLQTLGFILLVMILLVTMCWVVFVYHSQFMTTRIGEALMLTAILILLSVNIRSLKRISASKSFSNTDFLLFLKNEKLRFITYQQRTQKVGFAFASIGLCFYIFEAVHAELAVMVVSYVGIIIWCCVSWFIVRSIAIKRKTKKLNKTINRLEQFSKQLQTNEIN